MSNEEPLCVHYKVCERQEYCNGKKCSDYVEETQGEYTEEHMKQAIKENFDIGYEMAKNKYQRPNGVWLQRWKEYECSQCGYFVIPTENWLPNFCPNCGADMRGTTNEKDNL